MKLKITVHEVAYEVDVEVLEGNVPTHAPIPLYMPPANSNTAYHPQTAPQIATNKPSAEQNNLNGIISPVAGTVKEIKCKAGDTVKRGQTVLIVETMKMETNISADKDAVVRKIDVSAGEAIREGQTLIEYE
ncbi:MAG: hypothetical protein LBH05_01085 [Deferribacteraceae bacterium]|jgi:biotin carboxyl carrier protein|nr:hypothetical protein [Deferribacteraceae bacterium]